MRVLGVAFPDLAAGTASAGGAAHLLLMLDAGLVERGHHSIVVAAAGSKVAGALIESSDHRRTLDSVAAGNCIDLIHFHGLDFHQYVPETDVPMLATLHLPISFYPE